MYAARKRLVWEKKENDEQNRFQRHLKKLISPAKITKKNRYFSTGKNPSFKQKLHFSYDFTAVFTKI